MATYTIADGGELAFEPARTLLAGYTGRNEEAVRHHVEELLKQGIPAPETTPAFYPVLPGLLRPLDVLVSLDGNTSGEAECVFLFTDEGIFVGLGSDHTDRKLEQVSVVHSKQLCPKPISSTVWRLDDGLRERWDHLQLRSWAWVAGERLPYQDGGISALMGPDRLFEVTAPHVEGGLSSLALFGGTLPTLDGELRIADRFEAELSDPVTGRTLRLDYQVRPLGWFHG